MRTPAVLALSKETTEWLRTSGVRILVVLLIATVVSLAARAVVERALRRAQTGAGPDVLQTKRAATIANVLVNTIRVVVWTVAILVILDELNVRIGPLIAGAGVAGVALGFGAQSLVRDFLSGFFILVENQFDVGDRVELTVAGMKVEGSVRRMTFRITEVRTDDGSIHAVPNGQIQWAANRSRGTALPTG